MNENNEKGFFDGPPKTMFAFGIVSGIAVVALLTVLLGGIKPPDRSGIEADKVAVADNIAPTADAPVPAAMPDIASDDHVLGDLNKAKVVLVEYSDFECPFCSRHHETMKTLVYEYGEDVAWVWRHFPLTNIHPHAVSAAVASECASDQGKFWEMANGLIDQQSNLNQETYEAIAKEIGIDVSEFTTCLDSGKFDSKISSQQAAGASAGVTGTPATFINGRMVSGAIPVEQFESIVDSLLK